MQINKELEYRMYGLTLYNISPIQQGIQFGHAVVEYGLKYFNEEEYKTWANRDKTFMILNGGTSNHMHNGQTMGTMEQHLSVVLQELKLKYATFYEPDLNDCLTAIVFLVDERVFNYEKYPSYSFMVNNFSEFSLNADDYYNQIFGDDAEEILNLRNFLSKLKLA